MKGNKNRSVLNLKGITTRSHCSERLQGRGGRVGQGGPEGRQSHLPAPTTVTTTTATTTITPPPLVLAHLQITSRPHPFSSSLGTPLSRFGPTAFPYNAHGVVWMFTMFLPISGTLLVHFLLTPGVRQYYSSGGVWLASLLLAHILPTSCSPRFQ